MDTKTQKQKAKVFQELHRKDEIFVLPNAWDVGSAVVYEKEGFKCVGTTSAGVAYALGLPDGEDVGFEDLVYLVRKISNRISIPLSVDFEGGYSKDIKTIKQNAKTLINAGAVGLNIEDGQKDGSLCSLDFMLKKIKALHELKLEIDIDFVINARTDAYFLNVADEKTMFQIAIKRANAFKNAGADCIFIPGILDMDTISKLANQINFPLNMLLTPKFNDIKKLNDIGIKRLSTGSAVVRKSYEKLIKYSKEVLKGEFTKVLDCDLPYRKANEYFME